MRFIRYMRDERSIRVGEFTARVVCCGCQRDMGTKAGFDRPGLTTSGLCPACTQAAYRELARLVLAGQAVPVSDKKSEKKF